MSSDASWDTESEDVNMSWAAEAETTEALREAERHETGAIEPLPEKVEAPAEKTEKGEKSARVNRRPVTGAFLNFLPLEWKDVDVRKFLTTEVKIEEKKIVKVQTWKKFGKNQAIVTFDSEATLNLALKADKAKVGSSEIRIQKERKDKRPRADGPSRYRQARNAPSGGGSAAPAGSPFGGAKPSDITMNKEREQILAEQKADAAAAAAAAAAPAEGEAKPEGAAPAEGEAKPEGAAPAEAKPEAAAAGDKPKTEAKRDTGAPRNHQRYNNRRGGPYRKADAEKAAAAAKAAALKQKQEEERQKALKRQQKEKMMKQKAEEEAKKKKEKTHNLYDALGDAE